MISRIYLGQRGKDSRAEKYLKSWRAEGFRGISQLQVLDSYTVDSKLNDRELKKLAQALSNPTLETFFINTAELRSKFKFAIEIGYLPGVTDNIGHTVKEMAQDLLNKKNIEVYTSRIFLIAGKITQREAKKIASLLYNLLIERSEIWEVRGGKLSLPRIVPKVELEKREPVTQVSLEVNDKELIKIGKEGVLSRGPLALDLISMKAIQKYFRKLGREPNDIELESLAQTWSEHCKHTIFASPIDNIKDGLYKTYIKGATNLIRKKRGREDICVSVFSDNSGAITFDDKYLITHKVETHNSPSALDPFGGAITGIVGVNRDTVGFGLGAKPVANTYGFCFGNPEGKRPLFRDKAKTQRMFSPKRIMEGVIKGINAGGNTSGIPTVSGFVRFDERYRGKPLVFAGTVGLIPRKAGNKLLYKKGAQKGDLIIMIGGRVGRDGIHGATFSSLAIDAKSPATAVQIGDPITQKKLSDAVVKEARDLNLFNSISDNGAGGLSSSVAEMAKESKGAKVHLEKVPLKYPNLQPWEIWISESQERMTLAVPKRKWKKFSTLMQSRGVEATVIGEFTNSGKCVVSFKGKIIMDMDLGFLHNGYPVRYLRTKTPPKPPLNRGGGRKSLEQTLADKNIGSFSFISEQYDHEVQAGSVVKPLSGAGRINTDAQVFQPVLSSNKGVVLSYGVYPSYGDVSAYDMAAAAIDTAIRNAIAAGGKLEHLALLDNFCWCSSYDPKRLYQLKEAARACYDYAVAYGAPFISGKDSMFNDFNGYDEKGRPIKISVPPTLLISSIGVVPDINKVVTPEFKNAGDIIYLLGETKKATAVGGVPQINAGKNLKIYRVLENAIEKELLTSSLSVTSGGLGVALAKACIGGMIGAKVDLQGHKSPHSAGPRHRRWLFSESQGRVLVSVAPENVPAFEKLVKNIPYTRLGEVAKGNLKIDKKSHSLNKLRHAYHKFSNQWK